MSNRRSPEFGVDGIPRLLCWDNAPISWSYQAGVLTIRAAAKTDLFIDPRGMTNATNSPRALFEPAAEFTLSSRVRVHFDKEYDAGLLVLYGGKQRWAKLCLEFSPQRVPTLVSVVNRRNSDDCNHASIAGREAYLRISGLGRSAFAFHYSLEGRQWTLLRYFHLESREKIRVGFSSQSPIADFCESFFSEIRYSDGLLQDIRNLQ